MRVISKQYTMTADGFGGWTDQVIAEPKPDMNGVLRAAHVGVSGLDGGTWSIYAKIPGNDDVWFLLAAAKADSTIHSISEPAIPVDQLKIAVSGTGGNAAPLVDLLRVPWDARQGM